MQCLTCGSELDPERYRCPICTESKAQGKIARIVAWLEDGLLVFFLAAMTLLVLSQILLRYGFETGIAGGDSLVRHLVLWIAFFGAATAAKSGAHVKIDVLPRLLPDAVNRWTQVLTDLFSLAVCGLLLYASLRFIEIEYQGYGRSAFLDVPLWCMEIIIPVGYFMLAVRFAHRVYDGFRANLGRK